MSISQLERVQRICMALPATIERVSHGEPTFFVRGKVYVMLDLPIPERLCFTEPEIVV